MDTGPGLGLFSIIPVLVVIGFVVVIGMMILQGVKGVGKWNYNNKQPVLSVRTRVAGKRMDVSHHHHDGHNHSSTTYYATFEVESGDRMELKVDGSDYGMLAEGDIGQLTFQGTRYLGFEREA